MTVNNPGGGGGSATITGTFQGTAAARPAPGTAPAGALYYATDTGEYSLNNLAQNAWQTLKQTTAPNFNVGAGAATYGSTGNDYQITSANGFLAQGNVGAGAHAWNVTSSGAVDVHSAGFGLQVAEGSNAKQGTIAAMTAGSITVSNTSVTANSRIFVCRNAGGTNPGAWYVSAQTAGTSFVATSTNAADTGTGVFIIFEPG